MHELWGVNCGNFFLFFKKFDHVIHGRPCIYCGWQDWTLQDGNEMEQLAGPRMLSDDLWTDET